MRLVVLLSPVKLILFLGHFHIVSFRSRVNGTNGAFSMAEQKITRTEIYIQIIVNKNNRVNQG